MGYESETESEGLRVTKDPLEPVKTDEQSYWQNYWSESVTLQARIGSNSRQFDGGSIQHARFTYRKADDPTNTPTAIQRVKEFLETNFISPK